MEAENDDLQVREISLPKFQLPGETAGARKVDQCICLIIQLLKHHETEEMEKSKCLAFWQLAG